MNEVITIESVSDFIAKILELNRESIHSRNLSVSSLNFYRGQSDFEWGLTPKLYRENLLKKESVLIAEFLRVAPLDFQHMDYFNILVKMQHYGLPTRLLDTTLNPLVALFFACHGESQKSKAGSIYVFRNLPVNRQGFNHISLIMKYIFEYSTGFSLDIEEFSRDVLSSKDLTCSYSMNFKSINDVLYPLVNVPFYAVLPTLNNQRILNQDGAFFLFGMKVTKIEKSTNPGTLGKLYYNFDKRDYDNNAEKFWPGSRVLIIPSTVKNKLLQELEYIGITRNRMFPELEHQSKFITDLFIRDFHKTN